MVTHNDPMFAPHIINPQRAQVFLDPRHMEPSVTTAIGDRSLIKRYPGIQVSVVRDEPAKVKYVFNPMYMVPPVSIFSVGRSDDMEGASFVFDRYCLWARSGEMMVSESERETVHDVILVNWIFSREKDIVGDLSAHLEGKPYANMVFEKPEKGHVFRGVRFEGVDETEMESDCNAELLFWSTHPLDRIAYFAQYFGNDLSEWHLHTEDPARMHGRMEAEAAPFPSIISGIFSLLRGMLEIDSIALFHLLED